MAPSLTSYSRPNAHLLGVFGLLNFAMIHINGLRSSGLPQNFIRFHLQFSKLEGLESHLNKVRTYQLSAQQLLRFKVRT